MSPSTPAEDFLAGGQQRAEGDPLSGLLHLSTEGKDGAIRMFRPAGPGRTGTSGRPGTTAMPAFASETTRFAQPSITSRLMK